MPYKDHERKRQWEREHREQRNAGRRKSMSSHSPAPSGVDSPLADPNSPQVSLASVSVATGVMMGLALLLTVLIVIWRFGSSPEPAARRACLSRATQGSRILQNGARVGRLRRRHRDGCGRWNPERRGNTACLLGFGCVW